MKILRGIVAFVKVMFHFWLTAPLRSWYISAFAYHMATCPDCQRKFVAEREAIAKIRSRREA